MAGILAASAPPSSGSRSPAHPVDDLFVANMGPSLDYLKDCDMLGHLLARTVPSLTIVQNILFFVYPERVLLSRVPAHSRRLLRQDFSLIRLHRRRRFDYPAGGLPVTLLCAAPGMWAQLLPLLQADSDEEKQDALCFAHHTEGFASTALSLARGGNAVRSLRVAVDLCEEPATGPCANGAAALLFSLIARGDLGCINQLTLLYTGGGRIDDGAFLAPLARPSAQPLRYLRTLRLCIADPHVHLHYLTRFAKDGGFPELRHLTFFGGDLERSPIRRLAPTSLPSDADLAAFLRAIWGWSESPDPAADLSQKANQRQLLTELDLRATLAGAETLQVLLSRLKEIEDPKKRRHMVINLEGTPAASQAEHEELYECLQSLLPAVP